MTIMILFLGKEHLKKFHYNHIFYKDSNLLLTWEHKGGKDFKPGMYNIVLRGQKPFNAKIGFQLRFRWFNYEGYDHYGFVQSDEKGVAVISTYLGQNACEFKFVINADLSLNKIVASSTKEDQYLVPHVKYPPHWFQRLGFLSRLWS